MENPIYHQCNVIPVHIEGRSKPNRQSGPHLGSLRCTGFSNNDLLARLSNEDQMFLMPHLELVRIPSGTQLFAYGAEMSHVYFPTTAVIALLYLMADGNFSEIGVVGRDGLLDISALAGEPALATAIVQISGYAYKLEVAVLREACERSETVRYSLMRYIRVLFDQFAQSAMSSRHYSVEQQFSRWLLNRLDRLPGNVLEITQAMVANLLGVRRESITSAACRLQQKGIIRYRRGSITVLDRVGLEKFAGECYSRSVPSMPGQRANITG